MRFLFSPPPPARVTLRMRAPHRTSDVLVTWESAPQHARVRVMQQILPEDDVRRLYFKVTDIPHMQHVEVTVHHTDGSDAFCTMRVRYDGDVTHEFTSGP